MKKIILAVPAFALLISSLALTGCGENGKSDKDTASNVRKETAAHTATTNIAFVNMDTVYSQYTLAKELNTESEKYATDHSAGQTTSSNRCRTHSTNCSRKYRPDK